MSLNHLKKKKEETFWEFLYLTLGNAIQQLRL